MTAAQTLTFGSYNAAFKALRFKVPLILSDIKPLRILHEYSMWGHLIFIVSAACLWHFLLSPTVIALPDFMDVRWEFLNFNTIVSQFSCKVGARIFAHPWGAALL